MLDTNETLRQIEMFDNWTEELLSAEFAFAVDRVLSPKQRFVLESRVEGKSWEEIAKILKISVRQVKSYKRLILQKLHNGMSTRLDNLVYLGIMQRRKK